MDKIEWLKARKIGGSDAAAIIGVHPFKTAHDVWERLIGETSGEIELTPPMKRGIVLEPIAADLYAEETGRKIRKQPQRTHPDYDFMTCNIDRQILKSDDVDSTSLLEIKCPGLQVFAKVKAHGLEDYMTIQHQHNLAVYRYSWGAFALFNAERWDLIHFDLQADQEFISLLIEKETEFWNEYVVPRIPPPIDADSKSIDIPQIEGDLTIVNGEEWWTAAQDLQEAQSLKKSAEELEKISKETIKELMHREEIHAAEVPNFVRFYYKMMKGNTSWKKTAQAVAKEAKLNVKDFEVKGKGYKKFNTFFIK